MFGEVPVLPLTAIGGTATTIASLVLGLQEYDSDKVSHSDRVCSIWRYKDKKTLKRVAKKHPRTKVWEVDEDMLENSLNGDISKVKEAIKKLDLYVKEVLSNER